MELKRSFFAARSGCTTMLGYICQTHGYQRECDVSEAGERLCYECGVAVTGLTGRTRNTSASPPTDKPNQAAGDILWVASTYDRDFSVSAFGVEEAAKAALSRLEDPQELNEIKPKKREYRAY